MRLNESIILGLSTFFYRAVCTHLTGTKQRNACDTVTGADGRQRSTMASPQLERHSAPSRVSRLHPPPPPDVVQSPIASPSGGRTSNSGGEIPSVRSPVTSRRTAESSPKAAPRTESGLARRTNKARPTVDDPAVHGQQSTSPVHTRRSATVEHSPEAKSPEDSFPLRYPPGHTTDNKLW